MELLQQYWDQLAVLFFVVVMAVRLRENVSSLRKDVDSLSSDLEKRDTYVEVVKIRAELDVASKNITALWNYTNSLRDRMNGHSS